LVKTEALHLTLQSSTVNFQQGSRVTDMPSLMLELLVYVVFFKLVQGICQGFCGFGTFSGSGFSAGTWE
jgi:hypothetical protein